MHRKAKIAFFGKENAMKRKWIISILSLVLSSLLLLACAKTDNTQTEADETADPNAVVEVPEGELTLGEPSFDGQAPDGIPQMPEGGFPDGQMPEGMQPPQGWNGEGMPQMPEGGFPGGQMPEGMQPPQGWNGEGQPPEPPQGGPGGNPTAGGDVPGAPGPGGSAASVSYTAANEINAATAESGKTYASATADENALLVATGEAVTITNPSVTKTGDSDGGDACNFYGLNAGVLCKDGAQVTITGGTIETSASGANGVFSYGGNGGRNGAAGDGTTVTISDTVITTTGSGSGGIMTTGGGTTYANNLTVTTSGQSSAPIRTDRGGGTVVVSGGTYTSNGLGSPAIYSTADITVSDATLVSNQSEGAVIEGKNSITLNDCTLTANNTQRNSNATFLDSIMLYQSMSGDADSGTAAFTMTGGSILSKSGHVFHVTNTNAVITLSGVAITNEDHADVLLSVCADGWSGAKNIATLKAIRQTLSGTILVGSDSELTLSLTDGSSITCAISGAIQNAKGETVSSEVGTVHVTLDATSTWTLTADTYITSFEGDASRIVTNGFSLYVNGVKVA